MATTTPSDDQRTVPAARTPDHDVDVLLDLHLARNLEFESMCQREQRDWWLVLWMATATATLWSYDVLLLLSG